MLFFVFFLSLFCLSLYHSTQPTKLAIPSTRRTCGMSPLPPSLLFLSIWNGLMQNKIPEKASIFENFVCDAVKLYRWLNSSTLSIYLLYRLFYKIQTYYFFRRRNCEWMRYGWDVATNRAVSRRARGRRATQNGDKQREYIRDSDDVEIIWLRAG